MNKSDIIMDADERQSIYQFVVEAARRLYADPDIITFTYSSNGYGIKFVAASGEWRTYSVYGCDEDENCRSQKPLFTGRLDEVVGYLKSEDNLDAVIEQIYRILKIRRRRRCWTPSSRS